MAAERALALPRPEWALSLQRFTERNASRPTLLEVDEPGLGAQREARALPLRGVSYDHHDDRVEIMLGDVEGAEGHLTHGVQAPTAIHLLVTPDGRDTMLRVAYRDGQALLRLD